MIIDFNKVEEQIIPNFKGGEKEYAARMLFDGKVRIMKGRLIPGSSIGLHTHDTSSEVIFMTKGTATLIYQGEKTELHEGQCHYCPKGHTHSMINNTDADIEFSAVVAEQ